MRFNPLGVKLKAVNYHFNYCSYYSKLFNESYNTPFFALGY